MSDDYSYCKGGANLNLICMFCKDWDLQHEVLVLLLWLLLSWLLWPSSHQGCSWPARSSAEEL